MRARRHGVPAQDGVDLGISLSPAEPGRRIGASEAAVGKAVKTLKDDGLLLTRYRRVIVTDLARMSGVRSTAAEARASEAPRRCDEGRSETDRPSSPDGC